MTTLSSWLYSIGLLLLERRIKKVYSGQDAKRSEGEKEWKDKIFSVYDQCTTNVESLREARKQFLPRLKDVVTKKEDRSRPCLSKLCSAIIKFSTEM